MSSKRKNRHPKPAFSVCRDCGEKAKVYRSDFFKAGKPRCVKCGGLLDYLGHWKGTKKDNR